MPGAHCAEPDEAAYPDKQQERESPKRHAPAVDRWTEGYKLAVPVHKILPDLSIRGALVDLGADDAAHIDSDICCRLGNGLVLANDAAQLAHQTLRTCFLRSISQRLIHGATLEQ